jgi:hypothetical protein
MGNLDIEAKYGGKDQCRIYRQKMETLSEDVVRSRLANRMPIGDRPEDNMPPDFAVIWLGEQAAARRRSESRRYLIVLIVAVVSAVAAIVAAAPVVKSWI